MQNTPEGSSLHGSRCGNAPARFALRGLVTASHMMAVVPTSQSMNRFLAALAITRTLPVAAGLLNTMSIFNALAGTRGLPEHPLFVRQHATGNLPNVRPRLTKTSSHSGANKWTVHMINYYKLRLLPNLPPLAIERSSDTAI